MTTDNTAANADVFRECLSRPIIQSLTSHMTISTSKRSAKARKLAASEAENRTTHVDNLQDADDLTEFVEYIATELFDSFPETLRSLSYSAVVSNDSVRSLYETPVSKPVFDSIITTVPVAVLDSLISYGLLQTIVDFDTFFRPVLNEYVVAITAPPPIWGSTRAAACEICDRDWIPLTYHHLIPKAVHAKVLKRGWHEEHQLGSVAWLCRACHSMVHGVASNEELARHWYSVELLRSREDVLKFADWIGRIRWKAR